MPKIREIKPRKTDTIRVNHIVDALANAKADPDAAPEKPAPGRASNTPRTEGA